MRISGVYNSRVSNLSIVADYVSDARSYLDEIYGKQFAETEAGSRIWAAMIQALTIESQDDCGDANL